MTENKLRVLVLDDEPIVCKRLQPALEKLGFEVDTFTQSVEAMHQIQQTAYDIVITDLKMKEIDGMRFLEEAKKQHPQTEVIVITGFRHHGNRQAVVPEGRLRFHRQALQIERDSGRGDPGGRQDSRGGGLRGRRRPARACLPHLRTD